MLTEAVSNRPWGEISQADYTIEQWRRACLIGPNEPSDRKEDYKLPVREPNGDINRNGVHAAAARIGQVDAPADRKRAAARRLVSIYRNDLGEDPPESLLRLAGMGEAAAPAPVTLVESAPLALAPGGSTAGRRFRVRIIEGDRWGSSAYYPADVLRRDGPRVFTAGTHMYLDHPTVTESVERPERSVRDLAGRLVTDATYEGDGLYADVEVFPHYAPLIESLADAIGVSIRASGTVEQGEAAGRSGPILTALTEAASVDFVTAAGAGGRVVQLLESRIHQQLTCLADDMYGNGDLTREERIALSNAISDALAAFTSRIEADQPQLYQRDLFDGPAPAATDLGEANTTETSGVPPLDTTPEEVRMSATNPGTPPDGGAPIETPELIEAQSRVADLERQLAEARAQVEQLSNNAVRADRAERQLAEARAEIARLRAAEAARVQVSQALAESGLPEASWPRVTAVVIGHEGRAVPLTESGTVDTERLSQAITAAIDSERSYIAALAEAAGTGIPRGLGSSGDTQLSEADVEARLTNLFEQIGLPEDIAKTAARGR